MMEKRIAMYGYSSQLAGTEKYILTLYNAIDRSKIQFDFLLPYNEGEVPCEKEIENLGGKLYREYYPRSARKMPGALTPEEVLASHPEWDGIYINWQCADTAYRLIIAAKKQNMRWRVIHAHNNNYSREFGLKDKIYEMFFKMTKDYFVSDFLACSPLAGNWLFGKSPYTVIPNAVPFEKFTFNSPVREKIRKELGISSNAKVIGFCGRLVPQKRPVFVVDIFEQIQKKEPDAYLLILGEGELQKQIESKVESINATEKVILAGSVENVCDYMQAMDCFLLPSAFEGFGIVLLEAQAAGLPCFASEKVIPEETNVTGNITFIDLKQSAEMWAEIILKKEWSRYDCMDELLASDYTVQKSVEKVMRILED